MALKYRPDIDGLRAVAVVSILLYHLDIGLFSGGYVGVDIFFVISGFLITSIIVREIAEGDFSLIKFYERRVRRIIPALMVMVAFSLIVGMLIFGPKHLADLAQSAVATSIFSSNVLFYFESGYFDAPSEFKPLLHTWSLAVEEQFYIFFPVFLLLIARFDSKKYVKWIISVGVISFCISVMGMRLDAVGVFYLIPGRAWELMVGGVLALNVFPAIKSQAVRDSLSATGLTLMAVSIFVYTPDTRFPGATATLPVVGTALIVFAGIGGKSLVGRILSIKPILFVGLISYSLYLWHWPIIVFAKYYSIRELHNLELIIVTCAIVAVSILSWRYIERPLRRKDMLSRKRLFLVSAAASVIVICGGMFVFVMDGLPDRYQDTVPRENVEVDSERRRWLVCNKAPTTIVGNHEYCDIGADRSKTGFVVWGDSHALAMAPLVNESANKHGIRGKLAAVPGCAPLMSIQRIRNREGRKRVPCHRFNETVLNYIGDTPDIKAVILIARWALWANGTRYKSEARNRKLERLVDIRSSNSKEKTNIVLFETGIKRTIDSLLNLKKTVILVNPIPEVGYDVPSAHFTAMRTGQDVNLIIAPLLSEYRERTKGVVSIFSNLEKEKSIKIVDPAKYLCDSQRCNVAKDGTPLYRDSHHISPFGSKLVSPAFDEIFRELEIRGDTD